MDSATNTTSTSTWKAIRMKLARVASLIPITLSTVVRTMNAITNTHIGTDGNSACR
jgi:hypothetical protein